MWSTTHLIKTPNKAFNMINETRGRKRKKNYADIAEAVLEAFKDQTLPITVSTTHMETSRPERSIRLSRDLIAVEKQVGPLSYSRAGSKVIIDLRGSIKSI